MFTIRYKSGWIHGYFDRAECQAQLADYTVIRCKNIRAAKRAISMKGVGL
jgi:hypothetical protein